MLLCRNDDVCRCNLKKIMESHEMTGYPGRNNINSRKRINYVIFFVCFAGDTKGDKASKK